MSDIITIKQAEEKDILVLEEIYLDVVQWLDSINKPLWSKERVSWQRLSKEFLIEDFYIAHINNNPAGCMALIDCDSLIWPEIEKGQSLFAHKLAVQRFAAGRGISQALLKYAVDKCREKGIKFLRLDTDANRENLMNIYEDFGFIRVDKKTLYIVEQTFDVARYVYNI